MQPDPVQAPALVCAECGEADDGERGWTLPRDVDDELVASALIATSGSSPDRATRRVSTGGTHPARIPGTSDTHGPHG